jgi:hypothetical protein
MIASRPPGNGTKYTRTDSKTHTARSAQFSLFCRRWTATHPGVVAFSLPWRSKIGCWRHKGAISGGSDGNDPQAVYDEVFVHGGAEPRSRVGNEAAWIKTRQEPH